MSITFIAKTTKGKLDFSSEKDFVTIGRSNTNDIAIEDPSISRKHCVFEKEGETFYITDLNSSNGTYINGKKVTVKSPVQMTDNVIIGRVQFSFIAEEGEEESTMRISKDEMGALRNAGEPVGNMAPPPPAPSSIPPTPPVAPPVMHKTPQTEAVTHSIPDPVNIPLNKPVTPGVRTATPAPPNPVYRGKQEPAGFWIRVVAYILDAIILGIPMMLIMTIFSFLAVKLVPAQSVAGTFIVALLGNLIAMGMSFFYMVYFWVKYAATPGKMVLKLQVLDSSTMNNLSYGKAIIRLLGYMLSSILFIGFILIAFSDKKKGLHDMIAGTVVVKK